MNPLSSSDDVIRMLSENTDTLRTSELMRLLRLSANKRWFRASKVACSAIKLRRQASNHLKYVRNPKRLINFKPEIFGKDLTARELSELHPSVLKKILPFAEAPVFDIFCHAALGNGIYTQKTLDVIHDFAKFSFDDLSIVAFTVAKSYTNQLRSMIWLFNKGADPNYRTHNNSLLTALARRSNTKEVFRMALLSGGDATSKVRGWTPLDVACSRRGKFPAAGYFDVPTPISVFLLFPEDRLKYLQMCIRNGARLPESTKYLTKDGRLTKILSIDGIDESFINLIPKSALPYLETCLEEFKDKWTPMNHFTWPRYQRHLVRTILLCFNRIRLLPPELQQMIISSGSFNRYRAY